MSKNLTTSGNYNITSPTVAITGNVTVSENLTVSGATTTVNTATLMVEDPLIAMASGNDAADTVDIGFYGLYDTSGSQDLYAGLFRDANDSGKWKLFKDTQAVPTTTVNTGGTGYAVGSLVANVEGTLTMGAITVTSILDEDNMASDSAVALATQQSIKAYVIAAAAGSAGGANTQVQYNNSGGFAGNSNFTFASGTGAVTISGYLDTDNIRIDANTVSAQNANGDVVVTANGTGQITLSNKTAVSVELDFTDQGSDPSATATKNKIYSKAPSGGGTGLYFVNNTTSGEMISKSKAIAFSLVFGG